MTKANLFIVGAPRSGTSSLAAHLRVHPEVFISIPKEPLFFCTDLIQESDEFLRKRVFMRNMRKLSCYEKIYRDVKDEKVIGEASTWYLYSKVAAKEINRYNHDSKIIVMIREPVSFLYSLHSLFLSSFNENEKDFLEALNLEQARKKGDKLHRNVLVPSRLYYSEVVKFSEQISRYFEVFGKDNTKVVIFDDFVSKTGVIYSEICEFLGVDSSFRTDFRKINANPKVRFPIVRHIKGTFLWRLPTYFIPTSIRFRMRGQLSKIYFKRVTREKLNSAVKRELMNRYEKDVQELSELLGRDLIALWGYQGSD